MSSPLRARILVLSDGCFHGQRKDSSGPAIDEQLKAKGWQVLACEILPDDFEQIRARLESWSTDDGCDVILTTGGTGLAPRDVTPEATRAVIEKEVPGLAELMRAEGLKKTRRAALSRALAGARQKTLIINLPGSPRGARESLESIIDLLPHAIDICQGRTGHPSPH
ncbi:MAG: MogA/MoaB family molybdenum cofactor biosynthesis protein [Terriglobia bacterium]